MPRSLALAALAVTLAAGVLVGTTLSDDAADAARKASQKCSTASLDGAYGVRFEGHSRGLGRFASVSLWTFDGDGEMTASETFNSENSGPQKRNISGRYVMRSNCTFDLFFGSELVQSHEAEGACVLVAKRREFTCLDNEEGWITLGTGRKV